MIALERLIRDVPDFPRSGIIFKDITPLLADAAGLAETIDRLVAPFAGTGVEVICAAESRGFIFGTAAAVKMGVGFVPIRKPGKLPGETISTEYDLEYGTDKLEMHVDALRPGHRVLMIDDLLATGGTMAACCRMVNQLGAKIVGVGFVIELCFLNGREQLAGYDVRSLIKVE
ncbi:MAG: adenine phosphoribosyltransferase [Planctomycetes bacterium]|nr:adenine phosphoribosyltransferase [Planctomycetota bacterium]